MSNEDDFDIPLSPRYSIIDDWIEDDKTDRLKQAELERAKAPRYYDFSRFLNIWYKLHEGRIPKPKVDPSYVKSNLDLRYENSSRKYHGVFHIDQGLEEFDKVRSLLESPEELAIAWYFHDVIYDTKSKDNEGKSARLAYDMLNRSGVEQVKAERIKNIILTTDHQTPPKTIDEQLVIDIDLSILGQNEDKYNWYSNGIRKEYSWVPEQQFKEGRLNILKSFLERPSIYYTDHFKEKYEKTARVNLEREIQSLSVIF